MHIWLDPAYSQQLGISHHFFSAKEETSYAAGAPLRMKARLPEASVGVHSKDLRNRYLSSVSDPTWDCDCDSDCDFHHPPFSKNIISSPSLQERVISIWDHKLRCSQDLYLAKCDDMHWLACNPI